jgi:hypothetical protein
MPTRAKKPHPPLTDAQRLAIHDAYVVEGLGASEIAERVGAGIKQVLREMQRPRNAAEKLAVDENHDVLAAKRKREEEQAADRIVVEKLCVRVSKSYLRAHLKSAKRLEAAAGDEATQLLGKGGIAAALGSPAPVIEKARLSVGLPSQVTQINDGDDEIKTRRDEFWKALHVRLAERDQPAAAPGATGGVLPVRPVDAEHVAEESGG